MLQSPVMRYLAIIVGTVLWDVGAVLQKKAVNRMPADRLPVLALLGSAMWMLGLLVTAVGWGMFVFGLDQVPISAARTITAGSYVVLAVFSIVFLRTPLSLAEWAALACVTLGIILLGLQEIPGVAPVAPPAEKILPGVLGITVLSFLVYLAPKFLKGSSKAAVISLFAFAALSGLLGSVGDLLTKVFLALVQASPAAPAPTLILTAAGFIAYYVTGFYMLSRAYQAGSVVGGVVVSDFFGRVGALVLGALALSEPIGGLGQGGLQRALGFLLVLVGSLFLGRFAATATGVAQAPGAGP